MTDIAIGPLQRTRLPPSRVGEVKPPLSLADRSGEIGLAFATAKFAGDHFDKLVATKAANEFATFQGVVNTEIENFNTLVKSRPGASFDELQTDRNKMITKLDAASKNATTRAGKQAIKNYMLTNKGLIQAKTQANMVAIGVRQQLATAEEHIKTFMNTGDIDGLEAFYFGEEGLVQAELMTRKFAKAQFTNQKAIMVEASRKSAIKNASAIGLRAWEASKTEFGPLGSKKAAFAAIQALEDISGDDKALAESKVNVQVNNRRAEDKLQQEQAANAATDEVNEKLNKGEFDGIDAFINSQEGITETQKNNLLAHATAYTKSVNDTKEDTVTTDETNISIDRIIDDVRNGRKDYEEGIAAYSELASGVKASEGSSNLDDIRKAADFSTNEATTKQVVKNGQSVTGRMRAVEVAMVNAQVDLDDEERLPLIAAIEERFFGYQTQLDEWAVANKDDPNFNDKYQKQVNDLFRPEIERVTLNLFQRSLRLSEETPLFGRGAKLLGTSEEAALARKRFKALEEHAVFRTMTAKEKDDAKKLFRSGSTLAEVVALLEGE